MLEQSKQDRYILKSLADGHLFTLKTADQLDL